MTEADLPAVLAIERAAFPTPWTETMFRSALRAITCTAWVARQADAFVGYLVFSVVVNECDLLSIAVAETARRQGIGRFLLGTLVDFVKPLGVETIWLDVRASNRAAQRLYERFGFQAMGRRKNYYQREGEDAIVMALRLSPDPSLRSG